MWLFIFLHDGENSLVHPALLLAEVQDRNVCLLVHFSIKFIIGKANQSLIIYNPAIVNFYFLCFHLLILFTIVMAQLQRIQTDLSENQKEPNGTTKPNTSMHPQYQSNLNYACSICSKGRISCPCPSAAHYNPHAGHSITSFNASFNHKMSNSSNRHNQRLYLNRSTQETTSTSIPKISFTYANPQPNRQRANSWVVPASHQNVNKYVLKEVVTTTVISPVQEIIYYPVIHNRIKYETPQKIVKLKYRDDGKKGSKGRRRSYLDFSSKIAKNEETKETKQPMTPEQFRKLTDWLLQQK